jgi:hypothetical protein
VLALLTMELALAISTIDSPDFDSYPSKGMALGRTEEFAWDLRLTDGGKALRWLSDQGVNGEAADCEVAPR